MLVDAAKHGDVEIPVFCYEPKLGDPVGACRMCLVEIEGIPKLQTACSTPVRDGMVVYTQTDRVKEAQNAVVEFLLVNHPLDCPVCDKGGECPLQDISMGWGPGKSRVTDPKRHFQKPIPLSPLIKIDRERCILCYRCVRFSQEVAEDEQLQLLERGAKTYVGTHEDRPYIGPFHGNIIELCPVGALTSQAYRFRARPWDIEDAGSVCTLCPSQCNVKFTVRDEKVVRVLARDNEEVDDGWLCDKGRFGYQMFSSAARPLSPQIRVGGGLMPASWDDALTKAELGLSAARGKVAAIVGGATSNEEGWLIQRMVRGPLASADVTGGDRPGLSRAARARLASPDLAVGTSEIDDAGAILVLGCDPMHEMPIIELRIRKAVRRNGAQLLVATERPTALDGGAAIGSEGCLEAHRYAPGSARGFIEDLRSAIGSGSADTEASGFRRRPAGRRLDRRRLGRGHARRRRPRGRSRLPARPRRRAGPRRHGGRRPLRDPARRQRPRPPRGRLRRGLRAGVRRGRLSWALGDRDPRGARGRRDRGADPLRRRSDPRFRRPRGLEGSPGRSRLHPQHLDVRRPRREGLRRPPSRRDARREGGHGHPSRRPPPAGPALGPPPRRRATHVAGADRALGPPRRRDRRRHVR